MATGYLVVSSGKIIIGFRRQFTFIARLIRNLSYPGVSPPKEPLHDPLRRALRALLQEPFREPPKQALDSHHASMRAGAPRTGRAGETRCRRHGFARRPSGFQGFIVCDCYYRRVEIHGSFSLQRQGRDYRPGRHRRGLRRASPDRARLG